MKILMTTHYFPPHVGGIGTVALRQCEEFAKLGHSVQVLTSDTKEELPQLDPLITIHRIPTVNWLERFLGIPFPLVSPMMFSRVSAAADDADVIIAHGHMYIASLASTLAARRKKKPLAVFQHNTFIQFSNPLLNLLQRTCDWTVGRFVLRSADVLIAGSQMTADYMKRIIREDRPIAVPYYGVSTERFAPISASERQERREKLGYPLSKKLVITARRLTEKNDVLTLINAAFEIENPDVLFVIAGDGPERKNCEDAIEARGDRRIRMLGEITDEQLVELFQIADLFVLPSKSGEGMPLVIFEALATGLPIVATASGGHVEILADSTYGSVIPSEQPHEMANAIRAQLDKVADPELQKARRQLVTSSYTWTEHAKRVLALLARR